MDQAELFNIYVEKLVQQVTELTKTQILQSAQATYYEKQIAGLNNKVSELQASLDALNKVDPKAKKVDDF